MYRIKCLDSKTNCQTIKALEDTYQLSRARIAFSLGYRDANANNQFIRFPNTTVISNEIVESKREIFICSYTHRFIIFVSEEKSKPSSM